MVTMILEIPTVKLIIGGFALRTPVMGIMHMVYVKREVLLIVIGEMIRLMLPTAGFLLLSVRL